MFPIPRDSHWMSSVPPTSHAPAELLVILDVGMGSLSDNGLAVAPCSLKEH